MLPSNIPMSPRTWMLATLAIVLVVGGAIVGTNMIKDIYGLYRSSDGRRLPVLGDERVAKYLLAMRYVPENFDAIIAGASITANWDVAKLDKLRVYNGSLNGGNIVEERALIEAALERQGISAVLLVVHPAMTYAHMFRTVEMKPELRRSALGSLSLWDAYKNLIRIRLGLESQEYDYAGTDQHLKLSSEMNINMREMWGASEFTIDPIALKCYKDLVSSLRARGIQIIFIVPPTSERVLTTKRGALENYVRRMRSEIGAGDLWMDLTGDDFDDFRKNPRNFADGVHLTQSGAKQIVATIRSTVNVWIAQRQLIVKAHSQAD